MTRKVQMVVKIQADDWLSFQKALQRVTETVTLDSEIDFERSEISVGFEWDLKLETNPETSEI